MGNQGSKLSCIPIKIKTKIIGKLPKPPSTVTPLFQEKNLLSESNNNPNPNPPAPVAVPLPLPKNDVVPSFTCQMCFKLNPLSDSFNVEGCAHFYCTDCSVNYIMSQLKLNVINLVCPEPGCSGWLNPNYCKPILPNNVSLCWEKDLSESVIPENFKFYCPYYDCSSLLINDGAEEGELIRESQCPHCKRLFCAQCKVPWHQGFTCEIFQKCFNDDDVSVLNSETKEDTPSVARKPEIGESSNPNAATSMTTFVCEICTETKARHDAFHVSLYCSHSYCVDCVVAYVESKLEENVVAIRCPEPECEAGLLELGRCCGILPKQVFDCWDDALCESVIAVAQKFYCPFKDCSALLIDDGGEVVKESECPNCRRMFCAQCRVAWHNGIVCEEFQKLNKDEREKEDIMLMQLADNKKWRRCPLCRIYVEKSHGCLYMKCRCGNRFCYNCGAIHTESSQANHYCSNCKRTW